MIPPHFVKMVSMEGNREAAGWGSPGGARAGVIGGVVLALLACALPVACIWVFRHFLHEGPVLVEMIRLHTAHCPFSMVARKPSGRGGRPPSVCLVRWAVKLSMHFQPLELDFE